MPEPDRAAFVRRLYPVAKKYEAQTGIPAEVFIGIAAHETNFGNAGATFGIKGPGKVYDTWEVVDGRRVNVRDSFRTYGSDEEAFQDFLGLVSQGRYAPAWARLQRTGDWRGFLRGLNQAGYATDPEWAGKIERFTSGTITPLVGQAGGPKVQARVVAQEDSMDGTDIIARLTAKLGAPSISARNPTIKNPDPYDVENPTIPNPEPVYRYLWQNGAYVDVHASSAKPNDVKTISAKAAQALQEAAPQADKPEKPDVREINGVPHERGADGIYRPVRTEGSPGADPAKPKPVIRQGPDGFDYSIDPVTGVATRIEGMAGKPAGPKLHTIGRSVYRETPDGNLVKVHEEPRDAPQAPYRSAEQAEMERLKLEEMRREALPAATRLIQDSYAAVGQIEQMLRAGQFGDPSSAEALKKASAFKDATVRNLEAGLRGTTVAAEENQKQAAARADRAQGEQILSQRLQTGAGLAQNLLGQASRVLMPKGATSLNFDPGAAAWALTEKMGGGPEISAFAKNLLLGAGAPQPPGPIPDLAMGLPGLPPQEPEMPPQGGPVPPGVQEAPVPPDHLWPVLEQPIEEDPMRPQGRPLSELLPLYARPGAMTAI